MQEKCFSVFFLAIFKFKNRLGSIKILGCSPYESHMCAK